MAKMARAHDESNVLCLGGKIMGVFEALDILEAWLTAPFEGGRHTISLGLIAEAEQALASCDCWNPADPTPTSRWEGSLRLLGILAVGLLAAQAGIGQQGSAAPARPAAPWPPPAGSIRLIIDADAADEVDDQYALALALGSLDRFRLEGLVAPHFGDAGGAAAVV